MGIFLGELKTLDKPSRFGEYIRQERVAAEMGLRELARALKVSALYLGEVERGRREPLRKGLWPLLIEALPNISRKALEGYMTTTEVVTINLDGATKEQVKVVRLIAEKVQQRRLGDAVCRIIKKLMEQ